MEHETRIEDNGRTGEDASWLPACSCGWIGYATHDLLLAEWWTRKHTETEGDKS